MTVTEPAALVAKEPRTKRVLVSVKAGVRGLSALERHPYRDEIEARLRAGWELPKIIRWIATLSQDTPRIAETTLWRYRQKMGGSVKLRRLRDAVMEDAVSALAVNVLEKEADAVVVLEQRLLKLLEMEQAPMPEDLSENARGKWEIERRSVRRQVMDTMGLYLATLKQHRETLQSVGMLERVVPSAKLEHSGEVQQNATGTVVHRGVYAFLSPDEAARLQQLEAKIQAGEIDVTQMYKDVAPLFRLEQLANRR